MTTLNVNTFIESIKQKKQTKTLSFFIFQNVQVHMSIIL